MKTNGLLFQCLETGELIEITEEELTDFAPSANSHSYIEPEESLVVMALLGQDGDTSVWG